jgi:transcriptional regulator with XRE-family HTH domain
MDQRRSELGDFLRSRRAKLTPSEVGLADGRRRRTPGLRREEVAELAGIGVDWYIRLEQGRAVNPSITTINALALALRLDPTEHAHLRSLARMTPRLAFSRESVPAALQRLIDSLPQPAYVTGRRWDMLAWNPATTEFMTDFARVPGEDRNLLVYMLTDPGARRIFGATWADEAKRMVAKFRISHDLWAGDPAFLDLVERLQKRSPEFAIWWETHELGDGQTGRKTLIHPSQGALRFEFVTLQANDDPALKLTIFTPL